MNRGVWYKVDDKKNIIMAVGLVLLILFGWPFISERLLPGSQTTVPAQQQQQANAPAGQTPPVASGPQSPVAAPATARRSIGQALAEGGRVRIDTPHLKGSLSLKGARIDDLILPDYRETLSKDAQPVRLFAPSGTDDAYFAGYGWDGQGYETPGADAVWTASAPVLTEKQPVTLSWANGTGQRFEIVLSVDGKYMLNVTQRMVNGGGGAIGVQPFGYISRTGHFDTKSTWTIHIGPMGVFNRSAEYDVDFDDLDESPTSEKYSTTGGWIGFTDKYWLAAMVPDQKMNFTGQFRKGGANQYQADYAQPAVTVQPGQAATYTSRLFAGAKEVKTLEAYQDAGIPLFDRAIDWGWFYWFEKPIFALLHWLFEQIGNFGVAIICLTFVVRAVMFPIAQKQFASMAAMRAIQPKMKALQEKHKDDKPTLQKELMDLYKKEKVNPFSGCLPIFLQIPIFFALYKVLQLTIEMRHQPFILWIKDLSAPDPLHVLNLFGLLPFEVPGFLGIGVLAIILGITMWLQFRLNPMPMDEVQKQVFAIMPWMMMFIMAPFAAGLLIYWITSNLLTIAQQKWLYSRHPQLKQAEGK